MFNLLFHRIFLVVLPFCLFTLSTSHGFESDGNVVDALFVREATIGTMEVNLSIDSSKKQKTGEESSVAGDRIELEDLPEPILLHILSFLPTKDFMKAGVLSKRWKYLWKSVNNFRFEENLFCTRSQRNLFRDAVDRVLLLRDPINIHCFSLSCGVDNLCEDEINYGVGGDACGDGDSNDDNNGDGDGDGDNDDDGSDNSDDDNDGSDGDDYTDDAGPPTSLDFCCIESQSSSVETSIICLFYQFPCIIRYSLVNP